MKTEGVIDGKRFDHCTTMGSRFDGGYVEVTPNYTKKELAERQKEGKYWRYKIRASDFLEFVRANKWKADPARTNIYLTLQK